MNQGRLELDELENAIDSLEMASFFLRQIPSEKKWKWLIIAIHQALYGFAICFLRGTSPQRVLASNSKKDEGKLINIWEALRRTKDAQYLPSWIDCRPLVTSPEQDDAIDKVVSEFRNEFEHFKPKLWSILVPGMPDIINHVLHVIRFLALESNCVTYFRGDQRTRVERALEEIRNALN